MTVDSRPFPGEASWLKAGFRLVRRRRPGVAGVAAPVCCLFLSACGVTAPFSAAPRLAAPPAKQAQFEPAPSTRPPDTPSTTQARPVKPVKARGAAKTASTTPPDPRHRQYYDERHHRFYYFDPALKAYFWEDGAPR